jgi:hypothetical protein
MDDDSKFVDSVPVPYKEIDDMCRDNFARSQGGPVPAGVTWGCKEGEEYFTPGAKGTINQFSVPHWTKEPPTAPGWYWFRRSSGFKAVVLVSKPFRDVIVQMVGCNELIAMEAADINCEWCGPLTPPCG